MQSQSQRCGDLFAAMASVVVGMASLLVVDASFVLNASAQENSTSAGLAYDAQIQGPVPIPPSERALQTTVAEPWSKVSNEGLILEGAIFDRNGNLLFCDVTGRRVLRLSPDKQLSTVVTLEALAPGGLAFHQRGRLFIAALDIPNGRGAIFTVNPDGSGLQMLPHLALANGVALSPDGKSLWATEFGRNLLHRIELADATTLAPIGSAIAYQFVGPAPDSMRTDADGNVYVAMYGQGRVLAFNRNGIPIGQVLLPGREWGHNLQSTSLALHPDRNALYVVTSEADRGQGATVFHARVFSKGLPAVSSR